jgi:hypothetical protein
MRDYNRLSIYEIRRQEKDNRERTLGKEQTFTFRNEALQALWKEELCGQISDGMWENTPNSGWLYWCNVNTSVGDGTYLANRIPPGVKHSFGFSRLIPDIGDRMLEIVQRFEPNATENDLRKYLKEIANAIKIMGSI